MPGVLEGLSRHHVNRTPLQVHSAGRAPALHAIALAWGVVPVTLPAARAWSQQAHTSLVLCTCCRADGLQTSLVLWLLLITNTKIRRGAYLHL